MAVSVGPSSGDSDVMLDVNTTPLIDVMLVLLVMLIITIPIQTHAVKLDMPTNTNPPDEEKNTVWQIDVDFDHRIYLNGAEVSIQQLDAQLYQAGQMPVADQPEIHIRPNQNATYGDVAKVMAHAQRLNAIKIGIIGYEQFPEYLS